MEIIGITALIVGGVLVLGRWVVIEVMGWRRMCDRHRSLKLRTLREEWREALPVILAEVDFSFKPTLTIEVKQREGAESKDTSPLEALPMDIQKYIAQESSDFAREDLVKRAITYRAGGQREWEEVMEMLKESVDHSW